VTKVLETDEMKARTRGEGLELTGGPPERFGSRLKADVEQWRRVMKESGMRQQEQ
jgi:tripartite-type tricarboxylate transporter receptor subunit TctC